MAVTLLPPGTQLGPYEVIAPLGVGGMGEVYEARDTRLDRRIAVKVLPPHLRDDPVALDRFRRETKAIAAISHPNILAIHDIGSEGGMHFAVTELLEGETLRKRMLDNPMEWRDAAEVAAAIAEGLAAAHHRGVVHRDLKPENIFLTRDGRVKILDFGLAQTSETVAATDQTDDTDPLVEPRPGAIMGTVGYMSPEQLRCEAIDARSDIFSLGCVFFEMIVGARPFQKPSAIDTMAAILTSPPDNLEKLGELAPPDIHSIVLRCLEKNRDDRFASAKDLSAALRIHLSVTGLLTLTSSVTKSEGTSSKRRRRKAVNSIAVLPFANASDDPNADYLSDGITETLINSLSHLPRLRVMASSTVFRYRGEAIDPLLIGRTLGVRAVLTGRLLEIGEQLIIRVELADVDDGSRIWGDEYRRPLTGILDLQNDLSAEIGEKLRIRLSGRAKKRLAKRPTSDSEAYQLYLKGRYQWSKRTIEGIRRGIDFYEQAIARDPQFALPWAGIADSYITLATNVPLSPRDAMSKAREAALRALEIDPELAEAHTSLGAVKWWYDWNRTEAEQDFQAALTLNPNYAVAWDHFGLLLAEMEEFDRASETLDRARGLDPLSLIIGVHVALPSLFAGQIEDAIRQLEQTLEMDAAFLPALGWLGIAWTASGDHDQAIRTYERALAVNDVMIIRASMGHAFAVAGQQDAAREILGELHRLAEKRYVSPYDFATIHAGLGELDDAFAWLDRAREDRSTWMVFVKVDQRLEPIRNDPRYEDLLERIGFA